MDLPNTLNLSSSRWAPASIRQQSRSPHPNQFPQQHPSPSSHRDASPTKHVDTNTNNALKQTPLSSAQRTYLSRLTSHTRFTRLLLRLRHKSLLLQFSHHRALNPSTGTTHASTSTNNGVLWDFGPAEAETMFRVDFYEWYVLLERCLIAVLETVGVGVGTGYDPAGTRDGSRMLDSGPRGPVGAERATSHPDPHSASLGNETSNTSTPNVPNTPGDAATAPNSSKALIGDSHAFSSTGGYAHRFHESVLDALDDTNNPIHTILGTGRVRDFIGIAKEFRNRWKDFDVNIAGQDVAGVGVNGVGHGGVDLEVVIDRKLRRYEALLKDLQLDELVGVILEALERARGLAEGEVRKVAGEAGVDEGGRDRGGGEWDMEVDLEGEGDGEGRDVPFEAGVDAMEWD